MTNEAITKSVTDLFERTAKLESKAGDLCDDIRVIQQEIKEQGKVLVVIERLSNNILVLNDRVSDFGKTMEKTCSRLADIELAPGKKWEKLSWLITTSIITIILGAVLGKFVL